MHAVDFGGDRYEQCSTLKPGQRILVGDSFTTKADAIELRKVSLGQAKGVKVVRAWLLDTKGGTAVGTSDVPPAGNINWKDRVPAVGARVPAKSRRNVIVELELDGAQAGSAASMSIDYSSDGAPGSQENTTSYKFSASCNG